MCAGCSQFRPWFAVLIGAIAGVAFVSWHHIILKIRIDDPLDAVAGQLLILDHIMQGRSAYGLGLVFENQDFINVSIELYPIIFPM